MRVEIPVLKRCCFFLPLRRGLLVWAYLLVIFTAIKIINTSVFLSIFARASYFYDMLILYSIEIIILIPDLPMTIMFIIAAHRKNHKLFKVYLYYLIVNAAVVFIYRIAEFIWFYYDLTLNVGHDNGVFFHTFVMSNIMIAFFLGAQVYMILMVRSEMLKLEEVSEFQFTNTAAAAECSMVPRAGWQPATPHDEERETVCVY